MRTPKETAEHMRKTYGKNAEVHCMYAIMNNEDNAPARDYWRAVEQELRAHKPPPAKEKE